MEPATATLTVTPAIRDRLRLHGSAAETYNDILRRLLDCRDRDLFLDKARRAAGPRGAHWMDLEAL